MKAAVLKVHINLIIFGCCSGISYKHLQDSNSEMEKICLKPLRSVLNSNVFVYDGFNTELRINDFQQLHSRPINRSEHCKIHREEEQLDNLHHQYLSRKSWKHSTWFLLFFRVHISTKIKNYPSKESIWIRTSISILICCAFKK